MQPKYLMIFYLKTPKTDLGTPKLDPDNGHIILVLTFFIVFSVSQCLIQSFVCATNTSEFATYWTKLSSLNAVLSIGPNLAMHAYTQVNLSATVKTLSRMC